MILQRYRRALLPGLMWLFAALLCCVAQAQQVSYPTADAAADALVQAVRAHDATALTQVLGADWKDYIPADTIGSGEVATFLARYDQEHRINTDNGKPHLEVGPDHWVLPIPLVQDAAGWRFDVKSAPEEIRVRRIGANELAMQKVLLAYCDAQRDYASQERDGDDVLHYAQKFLSTAGKHDGLYWPTTGDEPPSPLGPMLADPDPDEGYYGYHYRILTAQGPSAPGGAYDYLVNGRMTNGFALIAWPTHYGETGVMTFIVSHDGEIFEKDLGEDTSQLVQSINRFDPDSSWQEVKSTP